MEEEFDFSVAHKINPLKEPHKAFRKRPTEKIFFQKTIIQYLQW